MAPLLNSCDPQEGTFTHSCLFVKYLLSISSVPGSHLALEMPVNKQARPAPKEQESGAGGVEEARFHLPNVGNTVPESWGSGEAAQKSGS